MNSTFSLALGVPECDKATNGGTAPSWSTILVNLLLCEQRCRRAAAAFYFPLAEPKSTTSTRTGTPPPDQFQSFILELLRDLPEQPLPCQPFQLLGPST